MFLSQIFELVFLMELYLLRSFKSQSHVFNGWSVSLHVWVCVREYVSQYLMVTICGEWTTYKAPIGIRKTVYSSFDSIKRYERNGMLIATETAVCNFPNSYWCSIRCSLTWCMNVCQFVCESYQHNSKTNYSGKFKFGILNTHHLKIYLKLLTKIGLMFV